MALGNGSSAGGGFFGQGSDPELALTEVSGIQVLLLVSSVVVGALEKSDPVQSQPSGLGQSGGGVARPCSTLPGASPRRSGPGRGGGGRRGLLLPEALLVRF